MAKKITIHREHADKIVKEIKATLGTMSLNICYTAENGETTTRTVTPLVMLETTHGEEDYTKCHRPHTLLVWCHKYDALRTMFLTSIVHVDPVELRKINTVQMLRAVARLPAFTRKRLGDVILPGEPE